uniref:transmembrane 9 family protein n=1 Tax=Halalkalibacter flavus TaxID=3090668 RepID=UPI002FC5CD29
VNVDAMTNAEFYSPGFALGTVDENNGRPLLNNHFDILVEYHRVGLASKNKYRVVGVIVQPSSRRDSKILDDGKVDCGG